MEALFFEGEAGSLFGLLNAAEGGFGGGTAMVICPPFGQEGLIAHNALRQLAILGARDGLDVFRFDYFGTGDSAGADDEFSLAQAVQDTVSAVREARDLTGASRVALVGMRLGGVLAVRAALADADVAGLLLWDPIVSGPDCVAGMAADAGRLSPLSDGAPIRPGTATFGYDGFPVTPRLHAELAAIDLAAEAEGISQPLFVVHSRASEFSARLPAERVCVADSRRLWTESPGADSPPVSTEAIQQIIRWCRDGLA